MLTVLVLYNTENPIEPSLLLNMSKAARPCVVSSISPFKEHDLGGGAS